MAYKHGILLFLASSMLCATQATQAADTASGPAQYLIALSGDVCDNPKINGKRQTGFFGTQFKPLVSNADMNSVFKISKNIKQWTEKIVPAERLIVGYTDPEINCDTHKKTKEGELKKRTKIVLKAIQSKITVSTLAKGEKSLAKKFPVMNAVNVLCHSAGCWVGTELISQLPKNIAVDWYVMSGPLFSSYNKERRFEYRGPAKDHLKNVKKADPTKDPAKMKIVADRIKAGQGGVILVVGTADMNVEPFAYDSSITWAKNHGLKLQLYINHNGGKLPKEYRDLRDKTKRAGFDVVVIKHSKKQDHHVLGDHAAKILEVMTVITANTRSKTALVKAINYN